MLFYFSVGSFYLKIKYIIDAIITITTPIIENHIAPFFSKIIENAFPNFKEKYATIKNLKPRANKQIKKKTNILKFIIPLVIVKSLNGNGVKPARNNVPNHTEKASPLEDN